MIEILKTNASYKEASDLIKEDKTTMMKLPEWKGFWCSDSNGNIVVFTKEHELVHSPWIETFEPRNDWSVFKFK